MEQTKIALGGGCHWCTEAVCQALKGVEKVEQGYVSAVNKENFSEAVIVHFDAEIISLERLNEIHLRTHKSTSNHNFRTKYRSAVYVYSDAQFQRAENFFEKCQSEFKNAIITEILNFQAFKPSRTALHNYYQKNPEKPFCKKYIDPKLKLLLERFSKEIKIANASLAPVCNCWPM